MRAGGRLAILLAATLLLGGCGDVPTGSSPPGTAAPETASPTPGGAPIGEVSGIDVEQLREALLGDPPYPSGWEAQVDEIIATVTRGLEEMRVPDVTGLDAPEAACALWRPLVGHTGWATGAFLERQFFIAHVARLAEVAPDEIRDAARGAAEVSTAAAAEQLLADGDPDVVSRAPDAATRTIGLWAVENCDLPIEADEPPNTDGWTAEEIAQSCTWDHDWLAEAQREFFAGPGAGMYAEHPHELEVTLEIFVYPAWHRLALVDNAADTPTFEIEPIPGSFCDR